jgi:hypothetical protein
MEYICMEKKRNEVWVHYYATKDRAFYQAVIIYPSKNSDGRGVRINSTTTGIESSPSENSCVVADFLRRLQKSKGKYKVEPRSWLDIKKNPFPRYCSKTNKKEETV